MLKIRKEEFLSDASGIDIEIAAELSSEVTSEFCNDSTFLDKPDVTVSNYINGDLLKTQTNALADGKTKVSVFQGIANFDVLFYSG